MNEPEVIKQPNLIVFARQNFSAVQKDIMTLAISQLDLGVVQKDLFQNQLITVTAKMLSEMSRKDYTRLKLECKSLNQKQIEISDDEKEEFEFIIPFPKVKYKKGVIELTMLAEVAIQFLELKTKYSEIYIRESLSLDTFSKKRLYELLSSFKNRNINIWKVSTKELIDLLDVSKSYKNRPKQFETIVVTPSVDAINELTSLRVKYTHEKIEKGIWCTTFQVENKNTKTAIKKFNPSSLDEKSARCLKELKELGVNANMHQTIVEQHQDAFWKWKAVNRENLKTEAFKNPAGVLIKHLGLNKKD
jgi:hypothetical protein